MNGWWGEGRGLENTFSEFRFRSKKEHHNEGLKESSNKEKIYLEWGRRDKEGIPDGLGEKR